MEEHVISHCGTFDPTFAEMVVGELMRRSVTRVVYDHLMRIDPPSLKVTIDRQTEFATTRSRRNGGQEVVRAVVIPCRSEPFTCWRRMGDDVTKDEIEGKVMAAFAQCARKQEMWMAAGSGWSLVTVRTTIVEFPEISYEMFVPRE